MGVIGSPRTRGDGPQLKPGGEKDRVFSPHTRGWPGKRSVTIELAIGSPRTRGDGPLAGVPSVWKLAVLPAHAGMARCSVLRNLCSKPFSPHTRGWPGFPLPDQGRSPRSPRTRGDGPADRQRIQNILAVLPAHAGMARQPTENHHDH